MKRDEPLKNRRDSLPRRLISATATIFLNIWFYFWAPFVLIASLLVYFPFVALVRILRPKQTMRVFRRCINLYGKSVALTAWPWIRVRISEPPAESGAPYVFVENHTSSFDPFVQGFLPFELVQAARGWALRFPILGGIARWAGYIDVDDLTHEDISERARALLRDGVSIVFFPEGTRRSREEGLGPFHGAAFRIACDNAVPVVPVALLGIDDKPRKGSLIMRPGVIEMIFLPQVKPDPDAVKPHLKLRKKTRSAIEKALDKRRRSPHL